jgi:hypothetical protein
MSSSPLSSSQPFATSHFRGTFDHYDTFIPQLSDATLLPLATLTSIIPFSPINPSHCFSNTSNLALIGGGVSRLAVDASGFGVVGGGPWWGLEGREWAMVVNAMGDVSRISDYGNPHLDCELFTFLQLDHVIVQVRRIRSRVDCHSTVIPGHWLNVSL